MMSRQLSLLLAPLLCVPALHSGEAYVATAAAVSDDVLYRQRAAESAATLFVTAPYASPALRQFRLPFSYGTVGAGWHGDYYSTAIDPQRGEGEQHGDFTAEAEVESGSSTLWGNAGYQNGTIRNVRLNESSDIDLIYPYVTADTVGGDLRAERYSFGGGYSDRRGRWAWGVALAYAAGLYYRNVDPRPRNTTSLLDIDAGAAMRIAANYHVGIAAAYRKYRQTCDLTFMSELGEAEVSHLTGLGNRYGRFTGVGYSNYYDGHRYLARLTLLPANRSGLTLDAQLSRFVFDHILKDLNRLPMASAWHNQMRLEAAWCHSAREHAWGAKASYVAYRRHGSEHLFGDATTGTYPQIGSLEMYADNLRAASAALFYEHTARWVAWSIAPRWSYRHRSQLYASPKATSKAIANELAVTAAISLISSRWYCRLSATAGVALGCPPGSLRHGEARLAISRKLRGNYALGIALAYRHADYHSGPVANGGDAAVQFVF